MSYFYISSPERERWGVNQSTTNYNIDANFIEPNTPMPVDWLALDNMYRDQGYGISNSFKGDTRYGLNTSITADTSQVWSKFTKFIEKNAFTIVDGSGYDIVDVSFSDSDQKIDLRETDPNSDSLYSSDIAGRKGNLYIAASTVIEEAITGAGDDILIGNEDNNTLNGGAGSDQLWGHEGANTLKSGDLDGYADELYVHAGNSQQKRDLLIQVDATDRIYIDGIKDDELTFKSNIDDPTGSNYVGIGIYANGILEALVVDSALTEGQISDITSAGEFS
jgi:serralysin